MNLWLMVLLLTLLVALISFYPLLRKAKNSNIGVERDELNKAFYFDRLKEIERDEQQGLLDNVGQLKTELQQSLLQDIPEQAESAVENRKSFGKLWFASGTLAIAIMAGIVYFFIGSWKGESQLEQLYAKLPYFYERIKQEETNPLSQQEMEQFTTALRVQLQKQPNDAKGWWMLGQLAMNLDNGQLAFDSYGKANQLEPENPEYKLSYARILMFSEDGSDKTKGEALLKEVIRKDHTNLDALSLLALNYFNKEDYKMAIVSWAMMLRLMPENDPKVPLLEKSIRSARDVLAEQEAEKHKQLVPPREE
ncbi:cytochrome c-type biogenesis protein CcmI [Cricetibacter osteomyelitidis]|uniref:Cytochrome c-type biogenesis protein CcmI n=1 Tax=Cricetibacter osteomyelitidis TaxID=1521931 RepID=A0A4R2T8Q1_9PAST|nr:c-type cytochrome biogenesis protein CcmI [Cricetibacter osteomyelitidis]TCP91272.1 cytochrome c-type biogenesis protein CcmI [Cricetibacter osteomyelitidis]